MAKRRRRKTTTKSKSSGVGLDVTVISLFIISCILFIIIYTGSGVFGEVLSPLLGGIMGAIKYVIPFGTLMLAFSLIRDKKNFIGSKIVLLVFFFACVCSIFTIYQVSKGNLDINRSFEEFISQGYSLGSSNIGGGAIGSVIAFILIKCLTMFGAALTSIGLAFILLIFTFNIHPSEIIADIVDAVEDRREQNEVLMQEREEKRLNRKKEREAQMMAQSKDNSKTVSKQEEKQPAPINENEWIYNFNNMPNEEEKKEEEEPKEEKKHTLSIFGLKDKKEPEKVEIEDKVSDPEPVPEGHPDELNDLFSQAVEEKEDNTKQVLNLAHTATILEEDNYEFPPIQLLKKGDSISKNSKKAVAETATKLQKTLYSFKVPSKVENISVGPAITRYELKPNEGIRVNRIAKLADDIAYNLAAESIRIEAPIPGKQAVGIEIPNAVKEVVHFRDIVESNNFKEAKSKLSMGLGKDLSGDIVIADISKMPHVLIAGATGSGKSVCINTLIGSILYKAKPSEVRMIMIDPKVVELQVYNGIPHLLIPVVTEPKKAAGALNWAVQEMENRYQAFAQKGVRDLKGFNEKLEREGESHKLPQMVIIIDELADLMMVSPKDVEDAICRLAQKARAAGMHLVIATQRPSVDVITGLIKANVPSRIAFSVASNIDSRTILDMAGAEKLLGKGDMLYYPVGSNKPLRVQGAFISDGEVESIVNFIKSNGGEAKYNDDIIEQIENSDKTDEEKNYEGEGGMDSNNGPDVLLMDAIDMVVSEGRASASSLQRRFNIGYVRAGRLIDQMYDRGIVSGFAGSKAREVLITKDQWQEQKMQMEEFEKEHPDFKISH